MNRMSWWKFYSGDWIKGTRSFSPDEKALWIDLLAYMWESPVRGEIIVTWDELARMVGIQRLQVSILVDKMVARGIMDLEYIRNDKQEIRLISRRMKREENRRNSNANYQREFRHKHQGKTNISSKKSEVRSQRKTTDTSAAPPGELPALFQLIDPPNAIKPDGLMALWNELRDPLLAAVKGLSSKRERLCKLRLREHPERDFWVSVIRRVNDSDFCKGAGGTGWRVDFDFLIANDTNVLKIQEGKYDNREKGPGEKERLIL